MHHIIATFSSRQKVPALAPFVAQAREKYDQNLAAYIRLILRRPLARVLVRPSSSSPSLLSTDPLPPLMQDFFAGLEQLLRTTPPTEVSLHNAYTRSALRRTTSDVRAKDLRKAIDQLYKRVDKHFGGDVANPAAEQNEVLKTVWKATEDEMQRLVGQWKGLVAKCYPVRRSFLFFLPFLARCADSCSPLSDAGREERRRRSRPCRAAFVLQACAGVVVVVSPSVPCFLVVLSVLSFLLSFVHSFSFSPCLCGRALYSVSSGRNRGGRGEKAASPLRFLSSFLSLDLSLTSHTMHRFFSAGLEPLHIHTLDLLAAGDGVHALLPLLAVSRSFRRLAISRMLREYEMAKVVRWEKDWEGLDTIAVVEGGEFILVSSFLLSPVPRLTFLPLPSQFCHSGWTPDGASEQADPRSLLSPTKLKNSRRESCPLLLCVLLPALRQPA
jgi:hypothetical protein